MHVPIFQHDAARAASKAASTMQDTAQEHATAQPSEQERKRIQKSASLWYSAGSLLLALQSLIMLVVLTRVCDVYVAGVFTIAFANANLFLNVGKFGVRKFQASDRQGQFFFREYRASRIATCLAMVLAAAAYIAYSALTLGYSGEKTAVMLVMCVFKAVEAFEDVYTGAYQLEDRLDVGARLLTLRAAVTVVVFAILTIAIGSLLPALVATTVFTACFLAGQVVYVRKRYGMPHTSSLRGAATVAKLLRECVPVFVADFLLFYMGNASKYAIDAIMDDAAQAYFGYISMPVFVVMLLASFIYTPMIGSLTDQWRSGDVRGFAMRFVKLAGIVCALTLACDAAAFLLGIPVLNLLYNAQLEPYLAELLVLMTGGGFLALATLATLGITIVRFQRILIPLYVVLSLATFFMANWAVTNFGITGASWAYFATMTTSALVFAITFTASMRIMKRVS